MDRAGHYQRAEQLAEQAADLIREGKETDAARLIALAQVHATLALAAAQPPGTPAHQDVRASETSGSGSNIQSVSTGSFRRRRPRRS